MTRLISLLARIGVRWEGEPAASRVATPMRRTPRTRLGWLAASGETVAHPRRHFALLGYT